MRTMRSRQIFTKKCRQQQIFDSDLKGAWHYNQVTFTLIAKHFMLYCRLIYMLSILCVRRTIKVKVGIPESFKLGWYPPKKLGRVTLIYSFYKIFLHALSEGESPDHSLFIWLHSHPTQKHVQNTLNHVPFMSLFFRELKLSVREK